MNRIGELFINDMDAFGMWGICLSDSSLCTLIEPEPLKDAVSNKATTENGKQVIKEQAPKVDERDMTLFVQLYAQSLDEMMQRLISFKKELKKRRINIRTKFEPDVVYRCDYKNCKQFKSYFKGMATFSLLLNEPNPANRGKEDTDNYEDTDL